MKKQNLKNLDNDVEDFLLLMTISKMVYNKKFRKKLLILSTEFLKYEYKLYNKEVKQYD
jgi:hypothetical protein